MFGLCCVQVVWQGSFTLTLPKVSPPYPYCILNQRLKYQQRSTSGCQLGCGYWKFSVKKEPCLVVKVWKLKIWFWVVSVFCGWNVRIVDNISERNWLECLFGTVLCLFFFFLSEELVCKKICLSPQVILKLSRPHPTTYAGCPVISSTR